MNTYTANILLTHCDSIFKKFGGCVDHHLSLQDEVVCVGVVASLAGVVAAVAGVEEEAAAGEVAQE